MNRRLLYLITGLLILAILVAACQQATPDTSAVDSANAAAQEAQTKLSAAEATLAAVQANAQASQSELATAQAEAENAKAEAQSAKAEVDAMSQKTAEPVSLTVWYLSQSPEEIALMQKMGDQFAAQHPGVTIDFSPYSFEDMNNTLRLALDGGVGPDVAYASPGPSHGGAYAKAGHLLDLTQIAKDRGWTDHYASDVISYFNDDPNQIYQMPFDLVTVGVYYNTEIFKQLGLEEPTTFAEFEDILAKIKAAGITPIAVGALDGWPLQHIWDQLVHTSVPIQDLAALETPDPSATYDRPEFVADAAKIKEWYDKGYFNDNMLATSYADGNNLFITGKAAINIGGTWNNGTFSTQPDFTVGFFPMPQVNPDLEWHMGGFTPNNAWMIPVYTPHRDLAIDYVDYMVGKDVATAKWNAGDIPGYKFDPVPEPVSFLQKGVYDAMQKTGTGYYLGNVNSELQSAIWSALQSMIAGKSTPEQAMADIQKVYVSIANP